MARTRHELFATHLRDSLGNEGANVSGGTFFIEAQGGQVLTISRLVIHIEDANGTMTSSTYGGVSALSSGTIVRVVDFSSNVLVDLTDAVPITSNAEWTKFCNDVEIITIGAGNDMFTARWDFTSALSRGLVLQPRERLEVEIQDNLVGLIAHTFVAHGHFG